MIEMCSSLTVSVVHADRMTESVRQEIVHLCGEAYGEDLGQYLVDCQPDLHVLARTGNRLVGHGMIATRWLQAGNGPILRTAYVELVATAPDYQGRGVATAVMKRIAELAASAGYDLAALCPADTDLYGYLGWEYWQGPLFIRGCGENGEGVSGLIPTPGEQVMVLRLPDTPSLDLTQPLSAEWRKGPELW